MHHTRKTNYAKQLRIQIAQQQTLPELYTLTEMQLRKTKDAVLAINAPQSTNGGKHNHPHRAEQKKDPETTNYITAPSARI